MVKHVELALDLTRHQNGSLSSKLVNELRRAIDNNSLHAGDALPASRTLAAKLKVSRTTVVQAYEQLIAEGYLESFHGKGTFVTQKLENYQDLQNRQQKKASAFRQEQTSLPIRDERDPEESINDLLKSPYWKQAWRLAITSEKLDHEISAMGETSLLFEIAEHLRVMRATVREHDEILVTAGAREGLGLILTALGTTSGRNLLVGVEEKSPKTLQAVAKQHGAEIVLLPVDDNGLLVSALPNALLDAVIVTPSYQYPTGSALPLERRHELIKWAKQNGALLIEDDFDAELRFLNTPLPTLAALDDPKSGVVATLGSFSATLSMSLAAGFLVIPGSIRNTLINVRQNLGCPVAPVLQMALANLLESGELRRHTARLRRKKTQ